MGTKRHPVLATAAVFGAPLAGAGFEASEGLKPFWRVVELLPRVVPALLEVRVLPILQKMLPSRPLSSRLKRNWLVVRKLRGGK